MEAESVQLAFNYFTRVKDAIDGGKATGILLGFDEDHKLEYENEYKGVCFWSRSSTAHRVTFANQEDILNHLVGLSNTSISNLVLMESP